MNTEYDRADPADLTRLADLADLAHCQRIAAGGATGIAASATGVGNTKYAAQGAAFDVSIEVLGQEERIEAAAGTCGEEVAAILEGAFTVHAADEQYRLSVGEGIIIPPGEPRVWVCTTERGVLYRAVTRLVTDATAGATTGAVTDAVIAQ